MKDPAAAQDHAAAKEHAALAAGIRVLRRGHAPNCSSSGSVVGLAMVSTIAAAAVVNTWAWHLLHWLDRDEEPPGPTDLSVRLRDEDGGSALVAVDAGSERALLQVDPALAARLKAAGAGPLGLGGRESVPGALRAPTEVHLAVTDRCPVRCTGCYLDAGPHRPVHEPAAHALRDELSHLAQLGVTEVAFGGGESLLRSDLLDLAEHARSVGLVPNLTTSGFGLNPQLAAVLAGVMGQVNVSLDGLGQTYTQVRGWDGAQRGLQAVKTLVEAGVRVGVNTVLTRPLLEGPGGPRAGLSALGQAIDRAGAHEWQWLRFKPAGRGSAVYKQLALTSDQAATLWPQALALEAQTGLVLRFDCALVPFLVSHSPPVELVERLGLRGCPGGHSLWARSAAGQWAACSFVDGQPVGPDPSDHSEAATVCQLAQAWATQPGLRSWRDRAQAPPEPCASCPYAAVCRGGCRVVSQHLVGDALAPDPECPRVVASRAGALA